MDSLTVDVYSRCSNDFNMKCSDAANGGAMSSNPLGKPRGSS